MTTDLGHAVPKALTPPGTAEVRVSFRRFGRSDRRAQGSERYIPPHALGFPHRPPRGCTQQDAAGLTEGGLGDIRESL